MPPPDASAPAAVLASVLRDERARLLATLVRRYGFDLAEECLDAAGGKLGGAWRSWLGHG